ncbi:PIG-L deacetylase family protein (plasmid) [Deinococcus radiomollis]|uniref:PIG-L deacetylase family protein n=1 Tax=Deinococcus radiomollis TaxID=468916 RepID=UPI003892BDC8
MTDVPEFWPTAAALAPSSLAGPVWVIAPHPDDESLGCGGLLAELTDLGTPTWALLLSDGGASHPASADWPRDRLARQRLAEWHAGLDLLGLHRDRRLALNLPDGRLPFPWQEGGAATVAAIRSALALAAPATVLLPWRRDPHPDHQAAHVLISSALEEWPAARRLEYTVWLSERAESADLPQPGEATVWSAEVRRQAGRKDAAIRCHASQLGGLIHDDPTGFVLQEDMIRRAVSGQEVLLEVRE